MSDWKPVQPDGLYPPDPTVVRQNLEALAVQKLDTILVDGRRQVYMAHGYVEIEHISTEELRSLCQARVGARRSRVLVLESDAHRVAALEGEVRRLSQELAILRSGKPGEDVFVFWRGSVGDLVTDIEPLLTVEQLQELACELSLKWYQRRVARDGERGGAGGHG